MRKIFVLLLILFSVSMHAQHAAGTFFMVKDGEKNAQKVDFGKNWKKLANFFPDAPRLAQYQKDKELCKLLSLKRITDIYNNDCSDASPEEIKNETKG